MKIRRQNKIRSAALQFTIFISVVIALILAGALLLAYTHRFFIEQSKAIIQNIRLADTGIEALKLQDSITADTLSFTVPNANQGESIKISLSAWGIYEKAFVKVTQRKKEFIKCSLLGSGMGTAKRFALYLQETNKPLAVTGDTHVEGLAFLPLQGIKPGNITGHSYYGTDLLYGSQKESTNELPRLAYSYKKRLDYYLNDFQPQNVVDYIGLGQNTSVTNSFMQNIKGISTDAPIVLKNIGLTGNIIIRSSQKVTIKKTAVLKDIILIAPIVEIEDDVSGNFQVIASKTIKMGKNCILNYPSALVLQVDSGVVPKNPFDNKIFIDTGCTIRGSICLFKEVDENNYSDNIFIGTQSTIKGEIYCQGNLELRGTVKGTVYTRQFITNEDGTVFVNHLYNATITIKNFPENFGGIILKNQPKTTIKWLY